MAIGVHKRSLRTRLQMLIAALTAVAVVSGCGLLGGSSSADSESAKGAKVEKSTLKISALKAIDAAPLHLARAKGYFKDEGLSVKVVDVTNGGDSVNKLVSGEVDISYSSYVPFFVFESKGVLSGKGGLKLVAEASSASRNSSVIMATPASSVDNVQDLAGKKIGVTATGTMAHLLVRSTMKTHNVPEKNVKWVATPFPAVAQALKTGRVDAAFATEPFVQDSMKRAGARPIIDTAVGPTEDIPLTGYATTGDFAKENPKTLAAFQRVMQRATKAATTDRAELDKVLVKDLGVDKSTAKLTILPNYQSKLDATRVQRVADMMLEFDVLKKRFDVSKVIVPTAPLD